MSRKRLSGMLASLMSSGDVRSGDADEYADESADESTGTSSEIEGIIQALNRVQDEFLTLGYEPIPLPKIVVVGTQSSGKSSVLEGLVGKSFLPRGTGIVTRCPLVLQLIHLRTSPTGDDGGLQEWGEFPHKPGVKFPIEEIRPEIEARTQEVAGKNKGICHTPISLRLFSAQVVDLTLVDLPGTTKVPTGDQPEDIEDQLLSLIDSYIKNPECIILAVGAANNDMVTNEALKLARSVDPDGDRTLCVVTKLDLMDRGTDAYNMLEGKDVTVKLGIIGVVNRSQRDIIENKPLKKAQEDEEAFFLENYPRIAEKCGTRYLSRVLHEVLVRHIQDSMPDFQAKLDDEIAQCSAELSLNGEVPTDKGELFAQIISKFAATYRSFLQGGSEASYSHLLGGGRILEIFDKQFRTGLQAINPVKSYSLNDVWVAMHNANGPRPAFFVSEAAFEVLVKPEIKRLLPPALTALKLVEEELLNIAVPSFPDEIKHYPLLGREMVTVVRATVTSSAPKAKEMIEDLIKIEEGFITFHRLNFLKEDNINNILRSDESVIGSQIINFVTNVLTKKGRSSKSYNTEDCITLSKLSHKERKHVLIIDRMLSHYFDLTREAVQDTVTKTIMCFMVKKVMATLEGNLYRYFHRKFENLDVLFEENETNAKNREVLKKKLQALQNTADILSDFAYFNYG